MRCRALVVLRRACVALTLLGLVVVGCLLYCILNLLQERPVARRRDDPHEATD